MALQKEPYRYDFFQVMRRIESLFPGKPRIGLALRPIDEPVRFAQEPSLSFAPATLSSFQLPSAEWRYPRMEVRFFGLLGPNGPLPLHLTEYARERVMHHGDRTFARFLDVFHHRYISMFYRAWAQAQPTVSLDRPREDRFSAYVGALLGLGMPSVRERDAVPDHAKLFYAGLLSRHVRNSDGLAALLSGFFRIPVRIEQFVGHWLTLPVHDRTRLAGRAGSLGGGAMLGSRIWDRQHKFRIWIGPLDLAQYESFLPGGSAISKIVAWVRQYVNFELDWDLRLVLTHTQVPRTRLGEYGRLGWTTWLGKRGPRSADVDDLKLNPEGLLHNTRAAVLHTATAKQARSAAGYTVASVGASF
ncbi:MAG: type secretion protein [Betaproteobacteria bacterium]|nr:type secretion protein [Betaproteobacteria bacterium]